MPLLLVVCLLAVACDQATKFWAVDELTRAFDIESAETLGEKLRAYRVMRYLEPLRETPITVVEGFWRFRYLENPGAAWGMLGSLDPSLRLPFFRLAPLLATGVLSFLYFRAARRQFLLRLSLAAIIGGAIGNFVDRWVHGYVVDFIDWRIGTYHWPTFNVADVFISLGLVGVALESLRTTLRKRRLAREAARRAAEAELEREAMNPEADEIVVLEEGFAEASEPASAVDDSTEPIASEATDGGESAPASEAESSERARSD